MKNHKIVSREDWLAARQNLLVHEKEFTRQRDSISQMRRELPWVKVDKEYLFHSENGEQSLGDLFGESSQLLVYHFMFDPSWKVGCKSCSFWADNYNGISTHLCHRDVALVAISRAPLEKLIAFKQRMGWHFHWVSSFNTDFNQDYHVTFTPEEMESGEVYYNFRTIKPFSTEAPGVSVFYKDDDGNVFHTYSSYSRGLDMLNSAYHMLDLVPKGRDEAELSHSMAWLRLHDSYED